MVQNGVPLKSLSPQWLLVGVLFLITLCPSQSHAEGQYPSASEKAASAAIGRLALLCKNAHTLAFTLRLQSNTPDGRIDIVRGFAEKPNKFRVEEFVNGKSLASVISNGEVVYAYQASTGRCRKMTALKTYAHAEDKVVREQTTDLLGNAFRPILMFFSGNPNLADPIESKRSVSYSSSPALVDGMAVTRVMERVTVPPTILFSQLGVQYDLDAGTGLLHEIQLGSINPRLNRFSYFFRLTFSSFLLGTVPLPASTFAWVPPVGSGPVISDDKSPKH